VRTLTVLNALLLGLGGAGFLAAFYSVVRIEWPASYFSGGSLPEFVVSRSLTRFLTFRLLPPFLIATLVAVTADRQAGAGWLAAVTTVGVHLATTSGRALVRLSRTGAWHQPAGRSQLLLQVVPGLLLVPIVIPIVILTRQSLAGLVPQPSALTEAVWTGLFVAVVANRLQRFTSSRATKQQLFDEARQAVPRELVRYCELEGARRGVEADVVIAMLYAEVLQRPRWWRRVEAAGARLRRHGTYGITQASRTANVSDEEAIALLVDELRGAPLPRSNGKVKDPYLRAAFERHHLDPVYVELAANLYQELQGRNAEASDTLAEDGYPLVTVTRMQRSGFEWQVSGTMSSRVTGLELAAGDHGQVAALARPVSSRGRYSWMLKVPLEYGPLQLYAGLGVASTTSAQFTLYLRPFPN